MIDATIFRGTRAGSEAIVARGPDQPERARRLIVVSNRGPIEHAVTSDGRIKARRGSGGVVTALAALDREVELTWIAAAMTEGDRQVAARPELAPTDPTSDRLSLRLLALPEKVYQRYYNLFANRLLWFLQHYMLDTAYGAGIDAVSRRAWVQGYTVANQAFARALCEEIARHLEPPIVLIQDYHLYLVSGLARQLGARATFQHFVHIPWPAPEYWGFVPADIRRAICASLTTNDVIGFQTPTSARNFLATCAEFLDDAWVDLSAGVVRRGDHLCRVRNYPISIDVAGLEQLAEGRAVRRYRELLARRSAGRAIVRVDRLDPSKNIVRGFEAYAAMLERWPELQGKVTFFAFLVPSRTQLAEYQRYRRDVVEAIERVEARFARPDWRPIEVFYENNYAQAIAGMSLADVLLVNPIADGMNLVAKEGPIVNRQNGVLVLSEGAGAHHQLAEGAITVAPGDVGGTAEALHRALMLPEADRIARLRFLRRAITARDLRWWIRAQLADLATLPAGKDESFAAPGLPAAPGPSRAMGTSGGR